VVSGPRGPDNPHVVSKSDRRYPNDIKQPADLYRDPVNGDSPITHRNEIARPHVETVGWHPETGKHVQATHPNAEAKAAGNAKRTHAPLEPVGQTHSKYGGEHGKQQTRPESHGHGGKTAPLGSLNRSPMKGHK
jgi:hypothetical protein